jgi:acetyl-CoA synthetase
MRRVLAALSNNEDAGDVSTLANPEIVYEIRELMGVMKF